MDQQSWRLPSGERIALAGYDAGKQATAMGLSRDGALVALGDETSRVSIWRAREGELVSSIEVPCRTRYKDIHALAFDPRDETLAIGGEDCRVRLWKFALNSSLREWSHCD